MKVMDAVRGMSIREESEVLPDQKAEAVKRLQSEGRFEGRELWRTR